MDDRAYLIMRVKLSDGTIRNYDTRIYDEGSMKYYKRALDQLLEQIKVADPAAEEVVRWVGERGSEPPK